MRIAVDSGALVFGDRLRISLQRTLRVPDDGGEYPLPPGLGLIPVVPISGRRKPASSAAATPATFMAPMYQREAVWIGFSSSWPPFAVKVGVGGVNAISGGPLETRLHADPQDYLVCPEQLWLDGINSGSGVVRQFVAMPLGAGYSVEHAITGREERGGIQLMVYAPKPGAEPEQPPRRIGGPARSIGSPRMGLGAGGRISQKIYPDPHGVEIWKEEAAVAHIVILNSEQYEELTSRRPPPSPVDAATYTRHGLPWFRLYEEHRQDVTAPDALAGVKTITERDRERGAGVPDDGIDIDEDQIVDIPTTDNE